MLDDSFPTMGTIARVVRDATGATKVRLKVCRLGLRLQPGQHTLPHLVCVRRSEQSR